VLKRFLSALGEYIMLEHFFSGSAMCAVDETGRVSLPPFVRAVLERRSDAQTVTLGLHEDGTCLHGFDRNHGRRLYADHERRRWMEGDKGAHHGRARITFGTAEDAPLESNGEVTLPTMMRRKSGIDALALFVGVGGVFEIWNPEVALESDDEALRDLAAWRFEECRATPNQLQT
jgi:DNA-binding transcriptional regulator/RsmH inhibitor MraZ